MGKSNQTTLTPANVVRFKRVHWDAVLPRYATPGSAAFDLFPTEGGHIAPGGTLIVGTGLIPEIPAGYCMKIYSRSGQGFKHHVSLVNSVGIIDSDYRAEILVGLRNDHRHEVYEVKPDVAVAQAVIEPITQWSFEEIAAVSETERGEGGFGSTDVHFTAHNTLNPSDTPQD
jgi:dUTP pyrophosphatase